MGTLKYACKDPGEEKKQQVITIRTDGILAAMAIGKNGRFGDI